MKVPLASLAAAVFLGLVSAAHADTPPPPCTGGTPSATLSDLNQRQPYGATHQFGIDWQDPPDYLPVFDAQLTMQNTGTGEVFASHMIEPDDPGPFGLRMDLDVPPAKVMLSYTETPVNGDPACTREFSQLVTGYRHFLLPSRCEHGRYRPRSVVVACGDGNLFLRGLRWHGWNRSIALAKGTAMANDCKPYCAVGHFHAYRARVRVHRPRRCASDNNIRYTRLDITIPGQHHPTLRDIPFPCPR